MGVFRQFPYSNFHEMNMDEIIKIVKNMLEEWAQYHAEWDEWMSEINEDWSNYQEVMNEAWQDMQNFINNYFDNLDVQNEINNKITSMVNSGEFDAIVEPYIPPRVTAWLTEHITQPVGVVIDTSLTVSGACADAKATGDAIGDAINDLTSAINSKFGFKNIVYKTMFETGGAEYSGDGYTSARRWFINHVFSKGTTIKKINFGCSGNSSNPNRVQNFEIWEKSNDTLTKVKTVSVDVSQTTQQQQVKYFDAEINYTSANECMISWISTGTPSSLLYTIDGDGNDYVIVSTDTSLDTTSLLYSSLATFSVKTLPDMEVTYSSYEGVNIVTIGEEMDYEEIQPALLAITDDSESNPYTLLLMPKGAPYEPFSMIRNSFSDNYPWNSIKPRHISVIGLDKAHCVIRSDSGNYEKPCGEPLTNGVIKNLTFVMTNDEQDPTATQGGYCLHIDCRTLNDVGYNMTIEDCDFECASGPCLGIGMHEDCNLKIKRCNFKTTLSASYAPHEGYRNLYDFGCIFTHTSSRADAQNQRITFEDCVGVCNEGNKSLQIASTGSYDPSTAEFTYTLLRNVFWNVASNLPKYSISNNLTANPMNFGNNNA